MNKLPNPMGPFLPLDTDPTRTTRDSMCVAPGTGLCMVLVTQGPRPLHPWLDTVRELED